MKIQLLYFDGCPNVEAAAAALQRCMDSEGLTESIERVDVNASDTPRSLRTWGSPTILINGADVGGDSSSDASCCRLYVNSKNRGIPSDSAITAMLQDAQVASEAIASETTTTSEKSRNKQR